jgi:hypothetical protein
VLTELERMWKEARLVILISVWKPEKNHEILPGWSMRKSFLNIIYIKLELHRFRDVVGKAVSKKLKVHKSTSF